ncbi:hypothetical protein [Frigoriglobus tundricola]|uniref:Glycosyltransferase RgtA/B/C/D-like domain-containing protein n=1 Tax=Frigoriglobus tundricola TaxID=2774151 RepID=A0A6M5YYM4_9BACT|nr:hypothetical protein [Frigoriglobus tundricola]QJW98323.1 hypothetical protein FTUN_5911 [Frigoriglobus tundricola]
MTERSQPRFLSLFVAALAVRLGVVVVGTALIPIQPQQPIRIVGVGVAGFPEDLRPRTPTAERFRELILAGPGRTVEPWYRWDAVWMANIALNGYTGAADESGRNGVAFMPAMPACLAAAVALGLNPYWFGLIAANLAGAVGAAVFAQVAARQLGDPGAGWRAMALLLTFPTAFFYSAPYNEAFGLLFTSLALAAWLARRPARAGLYALGGSLARLTGVALGAAAVADWVANRQREHLPRAAAVAVGSGLGLVIFWCFLWWAVGDPFAGLKAHEAWGRRATSIRNPWYTIESVYDPELLRPGQATDFWGEAVVVSVFVALGVRAWRKHGVFWGVLALVPIAQMFASGTLLSAHRLVLAALPAFIELADLLRRPLGYYLVCFGFACAQIILINRFVHWQFAG